MCTRIIAVLYINVYNVQKAILMYALLKITMWRNWF